MKRLRKLLYVFIVLLSILILVTLYAKAYLYVTVTFNSNGGNKIETKKVVRREKIGELPVPSKKNYTFLYWTIDNEKIDENYIVKENIVLIALYEKNKEEEKAIQPDMKLYTIKYDTDGGSKIGDYTVVEGEKAKKPVDPVKDGYEFKEWTLDGKTYNFDSEVTADITLKATYIKGEVKTYAVTFDTNGGSNIEKKIVEENTVVAKPTDPIKKGYVFKEWQLEGVSYNFSSQIVKDITLTAVYEKETQSGTDVKLTAFRSTAKLLITQAEKQYLVEQTLGSTITTSYADITACNTLAKLDENYSLCVISINSSTGVATLRLDGTGKFDNYSCGVGGATSSTVDTACQKSN